MDLREKHLVRMELFQPLLQGDYPLQIIKFAI